ncbi:hypothetical protein SAMN05216308_107137 [Nitrosospira sp. Nsp13]|nr:hypothetical protein SAMN05216308_107137 [Nitrosospira sp. Nsp13]
MNRVYKGSVRMYHMIAEENTRVDLLPLHITHSNFSTDVVAFATVKFGQCGA